jgi:lysophospholipase L1-like esterase
MGLLVAALVLGLAELGARLVLGPPPPPVLVATGPPPGQGYLGVDGDTRTPQYQAVRLTGPFTVQKTQPRVIFVGGSAVHLGHYENRVEWPAQTGALLGAEAVNLGAPAMDSFDLVGVVEELDGVEHDALVVYTGHNDFGNAYFQERFGGLSGGTRARVRRLLEHLQLYTQLRLLVQQAPTPRMGQYERQPITPQARQATLDYLQANLDRIRWMCERRGVPMVLGIPAAKLLEQPIATCNEPGCPRPMWKDGMNLRRKDPAAAAVAIRAAHDSDWHALRAPTVALDMMRTWAADNDVLLVDVEAELPREPGLDVPASELFMDLVHLAPAGHTATAELMAPALEPLLAP